MSYSNNFHQIWLSAECEKDAREILLTLTNKKLIAGGSIVKAPSHFWWKGEEVDLNDYCFVMAFSISTHRNNIEKEYSTLSKEEVPMASFLTFEGNHAFQEYILEALK